MSAGNSAQCVRCGSILFSVKIDSINRTLAWTIAGLMLYCLAIIFPFLAMKSGAIIRETNLLSGVHQLYLQGKYFLAGIVVLTYVVIPLVQMLILLLIFIPLKLNMRIRYMIPFFRLFHHVKPWSMMEIYLLGILVASVKLGKTGTIVPGVASIAFGLLVFVLTFAISSVDTHMVWERLGGKQ